MLDGGRFLRRRLPRRSAAAHGDSHRHGPVHGRSVVEKPEMVRQLHARPAFAERFLTHMLTRNIRIEEDLIDQLFNSSEKRLARTLLLLARYGEPETSHRALPKVSQEMLAEMVGTTRSRVNFFMNKFRKLGFIEYNGEPQDQQLPAERRAARLSGGSQGPTWTRMPASDHGTASPAPNGWAPGGPVCLCPHWWRRPRAANGARGAAHGG